MAFKDLGEFVEAVGRLGEAKRIEGADPMLEIGAITEVAATAEKAPLLIFDRIKGHAPGYRVVTNIVNTPGRAALALGLPVTAGKIELVRLWKERVRSLKPVPPVEVRDGPVIRNLLSGNKVDITKFPAPTWHELDGGPYLGTACMVIMRDPDNPDWVNAGTYWV